MTSIRIRRPFDTHVHGRQGKLLSTIAPMTAAQFWGAIFEPNLVPPVITADDGNQYREQIQIVCRAYDFVPFVLSYLTDTVNPDELGRALADGAFIGTKFYPRGATTNSENGVQDVQTLYTPGCPQFDALCAIAANGAILQLHCELNYDFNGNELDPYRKEAYFFAEVLPRLIDAHPDLKISCEHLTCSEGAVFLRENGGPRLGCSITPHHLLYDRRDMFRGGLRPHVFCLPVVKAEEHNRELLDLVTSGLPFVYAGTDSAPHDRRKKECDCCSGGLFSAHAAVEFYAESFDRRNALDDRFEQFMSINGPIFYGLEPSDGYLELTAEPWAVDSTVQYSDDPEDVVWPMGYHPDANQQFPLCWRAK